MGEPNKVERAVQAPKGTRDFYPIEMARRRWIEDKWRRIAIRHGLEEIDGPTFEETELYTRKSGDGIVGEIFGVYSGKDEASVKEMGAKLAAGERGAIAPFALRPEFTPTLARMYAAKARQLPQPTKWFWQGPCYRAERPQRGRLREFWQWNCDVLGDGSPTADAETVACAVGLLESMGLSPRQVRVRWNHRRALADVLLALGIDDEHLASAFVLLDRRDRLDDADLEAMAFEFGVHDVRFLAFLKRARGPQRFDDMLGALPEEARDAVRQATVLIAATHEALDSAGIAPWCEVDLNIVRGLAYYTGMVFEIIVDGERAVAGGGRYDNLIETFGGPPTPAVGFGMGDVVLSLVLQDKGLMPTDQQIARDLGLRPDVFVISNGTPEADALVSPMLADLRRKGMHARRSYKSTKNIGKLLKEASDAGSRYAVIIEGAADITLKNLDDNTQTKGPRGEMMELIRPA